MQRLNAIDAITPAMTRTNSLLFQPFRWGRSWKLAASSYLELLGSAFVPFPLFFLLIPREALAAMPAARPILAAMAVGLTLIQLVFSYLGVRMELVEFLIATTRTQFVAPHWRQTADRVWPWFWLKFLLGTVVVLLATPFAAHLGQVLMRLIHAAPASQPAGTPDPAAAEFAFQIVHHIFVLYAGIVLFFLFLRVCGTVLHDFVLPSYLLETEPISVALRRGWRTLQQEPLGSLGYLAMKYVLAAFGGVAQYVANLVLLIPVVLVAALLGGVGALLVHALPPSPAAHLLLLAGGILLYLLSVAAFFYCQIGTIGYLCTFLECYGLYFLGGRYAPLGDLLEPRTFPAPAPPVPPPPVW